MILYEIYTTKDSLRKLVQVKSKTQRPRQNKKNASNKDTNSN